MADNHGDTIIKKVKKGGHGGHHGGAWKVAYADFVTAMMAFFLLLWLLNATTEEQKMGISNYFDPTAISRSSRSGSGGVLGGTSITVPGALKSPSSPPMVTLPVASRPQAEQTDATEPDSDDRNTKGSEFGREDQQGQTGENVAFTGQYDQKPGEEDGSIGQEDSYAGDRFGNKGGREQTEGELDQRGRPGASGDAEGRPGDRGVAEGPMSDSDGPLGRDGDAAGRADGGRDGETRLGEGEAPQGISPEELERLKAQREKIMFEQTAHELRQAIQANPELSGLAENLVVEQTPEGLRIQLVDQDRSAMFTSGSASMNGNARQLMDQVSRILQKLPDKKIVIAGHTDATPYSNQSSFSNWELSTERANASRRALLSAGLDPNRIGGIIGRADTDPLFPDEPFSPRNRRISIVVLYEQSRVADSGVSGRAATPTGGRASPPGDAPAGGELERRASLRR